MTWTHINSVRVHGVHPLISKSVSSYLNSSINHFLTLHQRCPPNFSLKMVNELLPKELHFGSPFHELLCYPILISVSLSHGVFVLNFFSTFLLAPLLLCALALSISLLHFRRIAPSQPLQRHNTDDAADIREPIAALSGINRATTLHFVSIQRLHTGFPPVISAEVLQNLH